MNFEEKKRSILEAFANLANKIKISNSNGDFSLNNSCEYIFLPLFRILFSADDFLNLNTEVLNAAAVDLVSKKEGMAIQVTSTVSAKKITDTLENFKKIYATKYRHIKFFLITTGKRNYSSKNKLKWKIIASGSFEFNCDRDIFNLNDLYSLILNSRRFDELYEIIDRSIIGTSYIDIESHLRSHYYSQLDVEKKSGKYIPSIFFENENIKDLARLFSFPELFSKKFTDLINELAHRVNRYNEILDDCLLSNQKIDESIFNIAKLDLEAKNYNKVIQTLGAVLVNISKNNEFFKNEECVHHLDLEKRYEFECKKYKILDNYLYSLKNKIQDLEKDFNFLRYKVFIYRDRAGGGKTNFVCDFVENFLIKNEIPFIYLGMSKIRTFDGCLLQRILNFIFDASFKSKKDAIRAISDHLERINKHLVFVIDGINEHPDYSFFNDQLNNFIEDICKIKKFKLILTCREEYFSQRFSNFEQQRFEDIIYFYKKRNYGLDWEDPCADFELKRIYSAYLDYFGINNNVAYILRSKFKNNLLLLRFFCETYGKINNNEPKSILGNFSLCENSIFDVYLEKMLKRLAESYQPKSALQSTKVILKRAIYLIPQLMLEKKSFNSIAIADLDKNLEDVYELLLNEDVLIRRDLIDNNEYVAFTYDGFRDYLLSEKLLEYYKKDGLGNFKAILHEISALGSQVKEGVCKFLFYKSRQENNNEFYLEYSEMKEYLEVFDVCIFNLDPEMHKDEDLEKVLSMLSLMNSISIRISHTLIQRQRNNLNGKLNIEFYIQFLSSLSNENYLKHLNIVFKSRIGYRHDNGFSEEDFAYKLYSEISEIEGSCNQFERFKSHIQILFLIVPIFSKENNAQRKLLELFDKLWKKNALIIASIFLKLFDFKSDIIFPYIFDFLCKNFLTIPSVVLNDFYKIASAKVLSDLNGKCHYRIIEFYKRCNKLES